MLKADVAKYFPSINHARLLYLLSRTIRDKNVLWLCKTILDVHAPKGIPVGALTSQLFANIYLNHLDHYIKDDLGIKYYIRYMDDFVILGQSKQSLRELLHEIEAFYACELCLTLNPKTAIFPISRGIDFCGYRTWPTHTLPRRRNIKRAKERFRILKRLWQKRKVSLEKIRASVMSFLGYVSHCMAYKTTISTLRLLACKLKLTSSDDFYQR